MSLIQKFGAIDLSGDSGEEQPFLKVLDEWMYILESGSFNVSVLSLDLQPTEELPLVSHCVRWSDVRRVFCSLMCCGFVLSFSRRPIASRPQRTRSCGRRSTRSCRLV